jgi:hypothetical protein
MTLLSELKASLVLAGAKTRLRELEDERRALLKILDIPYTEGTSAVKAKRVLITAKQIKEASQGARLAAAKEYKPTNHRSGWSKKRLAKFRATMKRKYGAPSEWPSTKAARGLS